MPAGKWNGPRTIGSRKATRPTDPAGTRIQKLLEENSQSSLDCEKKPKDELNREHGNRNVLSENSSGPERINTVQESPELEKTERKVLTVLIADDHPVVREGLTAMI